MNLFSSKAALLRRAFGSVEISRDQVNVAIKCPKCADVRSSKRKLVVRLDDGRYHCWVCGLKGRKVSNLFRKYAPGHVEELKDFGWSNGSRSDTDKIEEEEPDIEIPKGFVLLADSLSSRDPDVKETVRYVRDRGLSIRDLWYFKVGTTLKGSFRRRAIIPSFDAEGNLNYFAARSIDNTTHMKYLNARVAKKQVIFNELNIKWNEELTVVEGPLDLVKCDDNATCLLGSHLAEDSNLFRKIIRNQTPIVLALDTDARLKAHNLAKSLSSYGIRVRMASLPSELDVGDLSRRQFDKIKQSARLWQPSHRLCEIIGGIKTGSII